MLLRFFAFAILLFAVSAVAVYARAVPPIWSDMREIGAPLDGHWYAAEDGGCFADGLVYRFEPDRQVVIAKGIALTFGDSLVAEMKDGHARLAMNIPRALEAPSAERQYGPARFDFLDKGSELDLVAFEHDGLPIPNERGLTGGDLKRCGNYSLWGRITLLWRPGFEPGTAEEVTDPRRQ